MSRKLLLCVIVLANGKSWFFSNRTKVLYFLLMYKCGCNILDEQKTGLAQTFIYCTGSIIMWEASEVLNIYFTTPFFLTHQTPADSWSLVSHMMSVRLSTSTRYILPSIHSSVRKQKHTTTQRQQHYMEPGGSLNSQDFFLFFCPYASNAIPPPPPCSSLLNSCDNFVLQMENIQVRHLGWLI